MKILTRFALALIALSAHDAMAITINFDDVADGTVVNSQYAALGVTFANPIGGNVFAQDGLTFAPSSPNVVSILNGGVDQFFDAMSGAVDATFSTPQQVVSIDARPVGPVEFLGTLQNRPFLEAYNGSTFLGRVLYAGPLPTACCFAVGPTETLTFVSGTANITRVRFSSQQSQSSIRTYGMFDNLTYGPPAAPGPIGVQFTGGGGVALAANQTAGLVPQSNYNVVAGMSGSGIALKDGSGASTTASLSFSTNESGYRTNLFANPVTPDEILNDGILNGTAGVNPTITITGIPHAVYDLIVYTLDTYPRIQRVTATTSAGSTSYTTDSPFGDAPGYQDANAGTPYVYRQGTSNGAAPVVDSNYVRFLQLSGNVTISADAQSSTFPSNDNDNVYINGLQIVPVPEPSVEQMLVFAVPLVAWLARRRTLAGVGPARC